MENRNTSLKNQMQKGKVTIGSWITLGHPGIAEIMVQAGFDWLAVDMEHSAITLNQVPQLVQVIELAGCVPLVRVEENNPNLIKRVMDTGAHGVIVPMVNNKEDAIKAVNAVKYPPRGTRGVGLARAQGYGLEFEKYQQWVGKESIVIIQIEHIEAVNNLEEIFRLDGLDGFIIGPYDLSASIGRPGDFNSPQMQKALSTILETAKNYKIVPGFHVISPSADELSKKLDEGYKFLGFSLDTIFLGHACRRELAKTREYMNE